MELVIDFSTLLRLATDSPIRAGWYLFTNGGWVIVAYMFFYYSYIFWKHAQQDKWVDSHKFVILAIDIPKDTEQTPKAVEQLFATLSGAHTILNWKEKYLKGMVQLFFSFEIVSIDGYVQFLIRTPSQWQDLVESSIYAQYPDAEITEVEDYIDTVPNRYPNETHNFWGTEVIMVKPDVYPIKTYRFFEDMVSGEFKDPISSLIETMSKIKPGEQVWFQINVKPTGFAWPERSKKEAYKIAGKQTPPGKENIISKILKPIGSFFFLSTGEVWFSADQGEGRVTKAQEDDWQKSRMLHVTPGEKTVIEAIENKATKIGFECRMRLMYIAPLELYSPARAISSVFGSIKQFNTMDLNSFKPCPYTKTKVNFWFVKWRVRWRRNRLIKHYKKRVDAPGRSWVILNTEELASIWHFPSMYVKAPMVQRTQSKKATPPPTLPGTAVMDQNAVEVGENLRQQLYAPSNTDVDLSNKYYEDRFAKKDTNEATPPKHKSGPPSNLPTS